MVIHFISMVYFLYFQISLHLELIKTMTLQIYVFSIFLDYFQTHVTMTWTRFYLDDVASPLWPRPQSFALTLATNPRFALHLSTRLFTIVLLSYKYACKFPIKIHLALCLSSYLLSQLAQFNGHPWFLETKQTKSYHYIQSTLWTTYNQPTTLQLPLRTQQESLQLVARQISPTFHTGLVWKFIANNDELFPKRDTKSFYDFSQDDEQEWLIKEITSHRWPNLKELELEVRGMLGDTTWEPLAACKDLEALDLYLELQGIAHPHNLPKCIQVTLIM